MPLHSCALTSCMSARGADKEDGECRLTRVAKKRERRGEQPLPYTWCAGCKSTTCCECWEKVADVALQYDDRIVFNPVWAALLVRPWRSGSEPTKAFVARVGGGGTWRRNECPLCVEQVFDVQAPPLPRLPSGDYRSMQPRLLHSELRYVRTSRRPLVDGTWW